jgi:hypothetical protein
VGEGLQNGQQRRGAFLPQNINITDEVMNGGKGRQAKALVLSGTKHVLRVGCNRVEAFTSVVAFNALGHCLKPCLLFHRETGISAEVMAACGVRCR